MAGAIYSGMSSHEWMTLFPRICVVYSLNILRLLFNGHRCLIFLQRMFAKHNLGTDYWDRKLEQFRVIRQQNELQMNI